MIPHCGYAFGIATLLYREYYVAGKIEFISYRYEIHKKINPRVDFDKIFDKHGKLLGVLNYNLMKPVTEQQLIKVNLKINKTDSVGETVKIVGSEI